MRHILFAAALCLAAFSASANEGDLTGVHGIALHGGPAYPADFTHFAYINPAAPKGGLVRLGAYGGFDSLNSFIIKGEAADGLGLLYDTLLTPSADEPFSEYGLLAKSIDMPADRSWVAFTLREEARFSDGKPVIASDVVWTFNTLKKEGNPFYRSYYAEVSKAEADGPQRVKFTFAGPGNRELPLIVGQMPVLPEHFWKARKFGDTFLDAPIGSGPYAVSRIEAGRSISYTLRPDYWGKDLPVNKGRYNFGTIRYDYYRDLGVMLEALKAGELDFRQEYSARNWATSYDVPAVRDGRLVKEALPSGDPQGMQGFIFNTRRPVFADVRVRQAIALMMDFEWMNANLFYGEYTRSTSYFSNSELASTGLPDAAELKVFEPYRAQLPQSVFTTPFALPQTKGDGNIRPLMTQAVTLLKDAGYTLKDGVMQKEGKPLAFEFLLVQEDFVRVVQPFIRNLERIGIKASLRMVDSSQYQNRLNSFDFDMMVTSVANSLSPGNEQANYWGSAFAAQEGSRNYAGVKSPVIDALIARIIKAEDRPTLVTLCRALDRVLLSGWYVVPQWHLTKYRLAYWNRFSHPAQIQKYGLGFMDTWWVDLAKEATLARKP